MEQMAFDLFPSPKPGRGRCIHLEEWHGHPFCYLRGSFYPCEMGCPGWGGAA